MEFSIFDILIWAAFGLLLTVTGGVLYLTAADWRDRRRQQKAQRQR